MKFLRDKGVAVIACADTRLVRRSGRTAMALAGEVLTAVLARAGLIKRDVGGLAITVAMSEAGNPFWSNLVAEALGLSVRWTGRRAAGGTTTHRHGDRDRRHAICPQLGHQRSAGAGSRMSDTVQPSDVTREFWAAAADDRFLLQHDPVSGGSQFFPRPVNLFAEAEAEWREAAGTGTLPAVTTARGAAPGFTAPYLAGIMRLDEGPRVFAPLVNAPPDIAPGRRMRLVWTGPGGDKRYAFEPAD